MAVVTESHDLHEHEQRRDIAWLLLGIAAILVALAIWVGLLWMALATPKATPFDADGVRCYAKADQMSCIKTAEPPR